MAYLNYHATSKVLMKQKIQAGFSLIEIMIVIGILTTFLGFITFNLVRSQNSASLSTTVETFVTYFRSQQVKAMVGDTEGRTTSDNYGIYVGATSYTLFHGSSYDPSDTTNFTVTLDPGYQFSPSGRTVIFTRFTGEVSGYASNQSTISIQNAATGVGKVMTFNKLGVPTTLN